MALRREEADYWQACLRTVQRAESAVEPFVTAGPAGGPELTDELLGLYLAGAKRAGSSLLEDFLATGDRVPQVGDYWIVLASDGAPSCVVQTTRIEVNAFRDVPAHVAAAEGEGDLSVAHWKREHAAMYAPQLAAWGLTDIEDATVLTEFFEVVFPASGSAPT